MRVDVGTVVGGRYRVTGALGKGGMGAVFLAVQEPLGREVALKVLTDELARDEGARQRFLREAKAVSSLTHQNVVTVHDFGTDVDGTLFLVMERAVGRPLRAILDERGALSPGHAISLLADVCRGVAAAHRSGIVHGDLKPENILVGEATSGAGTERTLKVLDFGLARLQSTGSDSTVTRAGQILGTPRYLAPEQVKGVRDNPASDVYAMGIMLFEMLTGRPPFDESTIPLLIVEHMTKTPPAPSSVRSDVPRDLDALVATLLEKDPAKRPKDGDALLPLLVDSERGHAATRTMHETISLPPLHSSPRAPEGDVTLVFTDIESSSSLWERVPALMREGLRVHDEIMRKAIAETQGYEVKTQGDSFMIAFEDIASAARFATRIQGALLAAPWSDALLAEREAAVVEKDGRTLFRGLRVRVGFFCGVPDCRADPVSGRMDYFGPVVNRAARVESAAHGGQVLYGHEDQQRRSLALDDVEMRPLGPARLKGIDTPIHLVELVPKELGGRAFAAPRTVDERVPTNLPKERTPLIGRASLVATTTKALAEGARVVTLVGAAGVGKSRVGLSVARALTEKATEKHAFPGGVFHVAASEIAKPLDLVLAIARVLDVTLLNAESEERAVAQLGEVLRARPSTLLLVDDLDRARAAAARVVAPLSASCVFLVTARAHTRVAGERAIEVPSLDEGDAVALFVARAADVGATVSDAERSDVAALVRALDGLPLAVELAAGRVRMMKPAKMLERLARRFDLLRASGDASGESSGGRATSLRGALDLSWETLSDLERSALAQCSIFAGHFSLEGAERVVDLTAIDDMAFVLDVLDSLRERSLLRALHSDALGEVRFSLSQTVRAYASEQRATLVDDEALLTRYAQHVVEHGESLAALVHTPRAFEALDRLTIERPHLDAVLACPRDALAVRAALSLAALFAARGPVASHRDVVTTAMQRAERLGDDALLLRVLNTRGRFEAVWGRPSEAVKDLERAAAIATSIDDTLARAFALQGLVRAHVRLLDAESAKRAMDVVRPLLPTLDNARLTALVENEGLLFTFARTLPEAQVAFTRALDAVTRAGDRELEARILSNFGIVHSLRGFAVEATPHLERALAIAIEARARPLEGLVRGNIGNCFVMQGRLDEAIDSLRAAVEIHVETGNRLLLAADRGGLAFALFLRGADDEARALLDQAMAGAVELDARREHAQALLWSSFIAIAHDDLPRAESLLAVLGTMAPQLVNIGFHRVYEGMRALLAYVRCTTDDASRVARAVVEKEVEELKKTGGPATQLVAIGVAHLLDRRARRGT